jgi:hypothetical protein
MTPIGTDTYQVFALCPALTVFDFADSTTKCSGWTMHQTSDPDQKHDYLRAFTETAHYEAYGLADLWGSDMTDIANSGMIWAQDMEIDCLGPDSTVAGTISYVAIALGSQYINGGTLQFSINDLLACVVHETPFNKRIKLTNALVDHNLVTRVSQDKKWDPHTVAGGDWVVFAIVNSAFVAPVIITDQVAV